MEYTEYIELLLSQPLLYAASLGIAFLVFALIVRKQIRSVFDPLFVNMLFAAIGAATVIFLRFTGNIDNENFYQYVLSEAGYLAGLVLLPYSLERFAPHDRMLVEESPRRFLQCLYLVSATTFLIAQPLVYLINGIPIFLESRLDYYAAGGGIGLFGRILPVASFFCWYLLLHKFAYQWRIRYLPRSFDLFLAASLVASTLLSGSRSALLEVVFLIFYFRILHSRSPYYRRAADRTLRRIQRSALIAGVAGAFLVVLISGTPAGAALGVLGVRLVSSGDAYFMAYPGGTIQALDATRPLLALFGSTLSMFRLVDPASVPEGLGFQIFHYVMQSNTQFGPNPRHNIYGLVYFGFAGSLLYSAVLGLSVAVARNLLIRYVRLGGLSELLYVFLVLQVINFNTGIDIFITNASSLVLVAPVLIGTSYILNAGSRLRERDVGEAYLGSS